MDREEGLKQIDEAKWKPDLEYNQYTMQFEDGDGCIWKCYLTIRQSYCDRGHLYLLVDGYNRKKYGDYAENEIDTNDVFPRFFFSIEEATTHLKTFLKWRLWKHRIHRHPNVQLDLMLKEHPDLVDYPN